MHERDKVYTQNIRKYLLIELCDMRDHVNMKTFSLRLGMAWSCY